MRTYVVRMTTSVINDTLVEGQNNSSRGHTLTISVIMTHLEEIRCHDDNERHNDTFGRRTE